MVLVLYRIWRKKQLRVVVVFHVLLRLSPGVISYYKYCVVVRGGIQEKEG